tara:strand:- start:100 stop:1116 length:1017 start_codon:yes stop_codon:yes gene_type:complete
MQIDLVSEIEEYYELINNNSCTFYQSPKHLKFLEQILQSSTKFITAKENHKLIGVMPIFCKESKFGTVINSLPFFGSYGGIVSRKIDAKKKILSFLNKYNKENNVLSSVIISNPFETSEIYDKYYKFNDKVKRIIQCIDLKNNSEETIWKNFDQRVRRSIRKAEKLLTIENSDPLENILNDFYSYHVKNISAKKGSIKPKEFFTYVKKNFKFNEDYNILTAKYESNPIAYLLVFYFKSYTEYYMPAYDVQNSNLQGTSLLIWESIKKSLTMNMEYYNFGGTHKINDSVYNFKKGWGTKDYHYNYYIYSDLGRLQGIEKEELKANFKNFYVYNYNKISN